jgi:hypothetical protein
VQIGGLKFHIGPLQFAKFTGAQAVPKTNENYRSVALTVSVFLGGLHQFLHFTLCQVFAWPQFVIGQSPRHHCPFCRSWSE